LLALGH